MGRLDRTVDIGGILLMCLGVGAAVGFCLKWALETILKLN